jgi:hypothetical protein
VTAAPGRDSRACACSTLRRQGGRLPCARRRRVLPRPGWKGRKWCRVTGCPWRKDAPDVRTSASR